MKRLLILWLLLPLLSAAKVPVESDIKARIEDPASEQYYPNLRLRYEQADSHPHGRRLPLPLLRLRLPAAVPPVGDEPRTRPFLRNARTAERRRTADTDLLAVIEAVRRRWKPIRSRRRCSTFSRSPTHSGATTAQAAAYRDKMNLVLATIESSGDGLTEETPWHILMYAHAFDLLAAKNIPVRESSIISRTVEYIPRVKKDEKGVKGYYFDYGRIYWKKPEQGYKRERSWQFNNLKPWKSDKK